jgi:hypothetical protein
MAQAAPPLFLLSHPWQVPPGDCIWYELVMGNRDLLVLILFPKAELR